MKYSRLLILFTLQLNFSFTAALSADEPAHNDVRNAVAKSLPYIAERGQWWMDTKKCVSCHRAAFTVWAHASAADAGFDVDREQLNTWVDWSFEALLKRNDKDVVVATLNLDGVAQTLHATRTLSLTDTQAEQRVKLLQLLEAGQQDDGSWKPAGQLPSQKRPGTETTYVTTSWNRWMGRSAGLGVPASEKVLAFLKSDRDLVSTESLVVQLLDASDTAQKEQAFETILREQNDDGGWGWIREQESDALTTGQVLYAMSTLPRAGEIKAVVEPARRYLVQAQKPNGTWAVNGTKKDKQDTIQETSTYWGTCWAVIGLLESEKTR